MDWNQLAKDKCPRCNARLLGSGILDTIKICSDSHCLFKIDMDKFNKIVADIRKREIRNYNPDENLSALNNL